jgi:hypothetical protein
MVQVPLVVVEGVSLIFFTFAHARRPFRWLLDLNIAALITSIIFFSVPVQLHREAVNIGSITGFGGVIVVCTVICMIIRNRESPLKGFFWG